MISDFKLKFGRAFGLPAETITTAPVTVFVGPNNSGKSTLLYEIEGYCRYGKIAKSISILDELNFYGLAVDNVCQAIDNIKREPNSNEKLEVGQTFVGSRLGWHQVDLNYLKVLIQNPCSNTSEFCKFFMTHKTLMLDGHRRIGLVNSQIAGDLDA